MSKSLRTLISQSLCGHKNPLFIGSVSDARVPSKELFIYSCPKCMKVFSSEEEIVKLSKFYSYTFKEDGTILFSVLRNDIRMNLDIVGFSNSIINGKIRFEREELKDLLQSIQEKYQQLIRNDIGIKMQLREQHKELIALQSVLDNRDNIIQSEETLQILNENEKQVNNAGMLPEWLTSLLLEKEVLVPLQAYKLFHLMLSTLYGYEPMRYRWEWKQVEKDGKQYYIFFNRKTRRTR